MGVCERRDHGIGVFDAVKVEESHVSGFPDLAGVERNHPSVSQEACAEVPTGLQVKEYGEFLAVNPHAFLGDAVGQVTDLKVACGVNAPGQGGLWRFRFQSAGQLL